MGESDKNRKKVKNRTFQTKYHYGLHVIHAVVVYVSISHKTARVVRSLLALKKKNTLSNDFIMIKLRYSYVK